MATHTRFLLGVALIAVASAADVRAAVANTTAPSTQRFPTIADIAAVGSPPENACFDACPQPKDVTSDCYLKCYPGDKVARPRFAEVRSRAARVAAAQANLKTREDVQTESKKKMTEEDMITGTLGSNVWDTTKKFFTGRWGGLGRSAKNAGWFSVAAFR